MSEASEGLEQTRAYFIIRRVSFPFNQLKLTLALDQHSADGKQLNSAQFTSM